jgi:glycerophosphoryl diester phosphodiesterase
MAKTKEADAKNEPERALGYRRVGHKGADAITEGNTIESFEAAVDAGVDMIELDVLRDRDGRLVVAHDHHDALSRRPLTLAEALTAFLEPPLDAVEIDCDLKLPGREAELAGALAGHGLIERAMVSTMEVSSLRKLRQLEPDLRLGWTFPKTRRDWTRSRWAGPGVAAGVAALRRRFPKHLARKAPELDVDAVWVYHPIATPRLVEAAREANVELIAWTVDDLDRMSDLLKMGVDGVCSNDPRLFAKAERAVEGGAPEPGEAAKADGDGGKPKAKAKDQEKAKSKAKPDDGEDTEKPEKG